MSKVSDVLSKLPPVVLAAQSIHTQLVPNTRPQFAQQVGSQSNTVTSRVNLDSF